MASTQSELEAFLDSQTEAVRAKDIDRLMSFYTSDVVYFDVVPPLRFIGSAALRGRFSQWFAGFEGPIDLGIRDLTVLAGGDFAVVHRLSRARGTLTNGRQVGSWVRATSCCQRSGDGWLIAHEHISLPVNPETGTAALDLAP